MTSNHIWAHDRRFSDTFEGFIVSGVASPYPEASPWTLLWKNWQR